MLNVCKMAGHDLATNVTKPQISAIAGIAQMVEHLICNQGLPLQNQILRCKIAPSRAAEARQHNCVLLNAAAPLCGASEAYPASAHSVVKVVPRPAVAGEGHGGAMPLSREGR